MTGSAQAPGPQQWQDLPHPLRALVDRVRAVFPDPIDTALLHDGGDDFRAVEINGAWIFRFARRESGVAILAVEQRFLRAFAPRSPLPVPEYCYTGKGFVGYRKIAGSPLTAELLGALAPATRERIARQLGEFLSALHSFPLDEAQALGLTEGWGGWRLRANTYFRSAVAPRLSPRARRGALAQLEAFFRLTPPIAVVHGDLCLEDHVFCDVERQGLCGVIDFGDLTRDDPAQDFLDVLDQGGLGFFGATMAHYAGETGSDLLERVKMRLRVRPLFDAAYALEHGFDERLGQRLAEIEASFGG